jgi:hypothetical protein
MRCSAEVAEQLGRVLPKSIDRLLAREKHNTGGLRQKRTRPFIRCRIRRFA